MLWMLWALEGLGMFHWGTHCGAGRLAGSRLASSYAWTLMMRMLSLSPAGSHLSGGVCVVLLGEGGSPCRELLRGGGAVSYSQLR